MIIELTRTDSKKILVDTSSILIVDDVLGCWISVCGELDSEFRVMDKYLEIKQQILDGGILPTK